MFELKFSTSNAAFDDENDGYAVGEIVRILRSDVTHRVEEGFTQGMIFDSNGNRIGEWNFTRD